MNVKTSVVRGRWCDLDRVAALATESLAPGALAAWLVPDARHRYAVIAAVTRMWVEHALLFGDVFLLADGTAAAAWFHRYRPLPPPARYADRLAAMCGVDQDRFLRLDRALAAFRPAEAHNHLALLAVPGRHRTRRAAAVVAGAQRCMDTLGLPTYADVLADGDLDLFARQGYTHRHVLPVDGRVTVHAMWRPAPLGRPHRPARSASRPPDRTPRPERGSVPALARASVGGAA
ncbi:hypothetical protein ACFOOK_17875 [Micromonospora krabiensis]|uniref:N-acetyltransferase domain-containing protein n=1 Tax=Micromonospora krabiensis TaxID=307121 RepID=A0A1C3MZB6_9ACTN|nr:hypothetical protein [Micromonospora krabiensis]SBV25687.1 hypothetical protein GA0070620_1164 [Micromonospora krabiensis]